VDPRRAPQGIRGRHRADQLANVSRNTSPAAPATTPPGPEQTKALTMPGDDRFRLHDTSALRHSVHARESHTQRRRSSAPDSPGRLPEQPGVTSHRVSRQPSVLADRSTIANAFPQELFRREDYRRVRPADFARDDDGQALTMVWRPRRAGTFRESDCGDFADRRPRSLLRAE
jgi:hypothetical protein